MIKELQRVILKVDLPEYKLLKGDIGTVVLIHKKKTGFEVEFSTLYGDTITVATLHGSKVRPVKVNEIAHVRSMINLPEVNIYEKSDKYS